MAEGRAQVENTVRGLRIVLCSFMSGVVIFAAITLFLVTSGQSVDPSTTAWLFPILGGLLLISIVGGFVARRVMLSALQKETRGATKDERLVAAALRFGGLTIASGALAEAPALFGVITYFISGNPLGLLVSLLGILRLVTLLPSVSSVERFAEAAES